MTPSKKQTPLTEKQVLAVMEEVRAESKFYLTIMKIGGKSPARWAFYAQIPDRSTILITAASRNTDKAIVTGVRSVLTVMPGDRRIVIFTANESYYENNRACATFYKDPPMELSASIDTRALKKILTAALANATAITGAYYAALLTTEFASPKFKEEFTAQELVNHWLKDNDGYGILLKSNFPAVRPYPPNNVTL